MASDPFRSFFLRQVRTILSTAPSRESLRQLLASADPDVTDEDLDDETIRTRVLKELRKRVHPDKHPNDDTATGIFQDVPPFYEACCRRLHLPVGASSSQNTQPPLRRRSGASCQTWSILWLEQGDSRAQWYNGRTIVAEEISGACRFGEDINNTSTSTIANEIKEELMTRGPVVSVSFVLSPVLKQHGGAAVADAFFWQQRMNQTHAVMIVGWKLTAFGEVWLVHPPRASAAIAKHKSISDILIPIAFGQFGIDTLCLAPASDLLDKAWQPGPFLDLNLSKWPDKWMDWKKCDVHLTANELQRLSECLGTGFVAPPTATSGRKAPMRFVLRDERSWHTAERSV
ncbi:hypothetical protein MHU86_20857 [Fragilaria crotonensis]|nr:hypothetical protein MHU86_20857 [Fragilaria crotonensis]